MAKIDQHIEFVKGQIAFQERQALRFANEPRRAMLHQASAGQFASLLQDLLEFKKFQDANPTWATPQEPGAQQRLSLTWSEVEGLPPELLAELSVSESDRAEFTILAAIRDLGGVATMDRLLVHLYRQTGEIMKRTALNQKLYRMGLKELVFSVPGKKGVYSLQPISEEAAAQLT